MSVEVKNLTKLYGTQKAVHDISFKVKKGEIVGFLGPNGAGKSTTMKIVSCFIPPTTGTATVCGHDVQSDSIAVRQKIGYLPEHNPLYLDMYVREYLQFAANLYKLGDKANKRIDEMVAMTGLEKEKHKKIGQLSKGYRQRIGLAQAILHDPEVLILDEPTSGLDPNQLVEIRNLIKTIGKEKTVILSTHIMQEVQAMCDRVIIINNGQITADDTTDKLTQQSTDTIFITVEFVGTVTAAQLTTIKGVQKAETQGNNVWLLSTRSDKDIRAAIFNFAVQNKLTLLTLKKETNSLEDVFRQLTAN